MYMYMYMYYILSVSSCFTLCMGVWGWGGFTNSFMGVEVCLGGVGVWGFVWLLGGPAQNAHSGIERECVLNAALRHNIVQFCTYDDLLAISKHASILHHRWCRFLIWISQIRMYTVERFFTSTIIPTFYMTDSPFFYFRHIHGKHRSPSCCVSLYMVRT